ncbi:MAG: glutamate ABC transporter substrate-binding protein [Pseudonocardiaceae bacterium]
MSTRFALACGALAAVILTATAGDQQPVPAPDPMAASHGPPAAARPATAWSTGQALAEPECSPQNLRNSLRPQGPLPAPGRMPAGSTMARIAARGYLIVGIGQDAYPLAFRDKDMKLAGFDIDIVRDIAEAITGDREQVVFRPHPAAGRLETVRSGQVDLVVAAMTIDCPRRGKVDFSAVYYEAKQRVLANSGSGITGLDDLGGRRVCAARSTTSLETVLADPSKPIPVGEPTPSDCLVLLQLGEVDAVSSDDTQLAGMVAQDPRTEIVGAPLSDEPYGVAISKDSPDLVRFVNAVLERRAQDGRWQASYRRWLTLLGPPPSPPTPQYRD